MAHSYSNRFRRFAGTVLSGATLLAGLAVTLTAQAATLAEVRLVNRHTGQVLPVYRHQGEWWVEGRPGGSYAVDIANRTGQRILAVLSVDGVNAITGDSASAAPKDGYVLDPWQNWAITGWRKSDRQVAAFYFSENDMSYAARTGRPQDVGVIGVALFRERTFRPARPPVIQRNAPAAEEGEPSRSQDAATDMAAAAPSPSPAAKTQRSPSLGTGHGALEASHTSTVDFEAASQRPEQVVRLRYDSRANLVARGVIRESARERTPNPFPAPGGNGYVPDPPRW